MEGTPGPAGAAAACAAVQADITDIVRTDVTQTEAPLDDPVTGVTRHGCQLAATWTGAKQDDVVGMSQHVSARLTEQGWTEDQRYTADGPTGTVLGFRKDRLLALLSVDWQPGPAVQCPADQPITECQMLPEQRRYALTLQIGEATGGSADATSVATAVPAAGQETATPISSASPEEVIAAYWQAFAKHEATVAYDLLTPAAQARTTAAELASASAAVQTVTVVRTEPLADGADRSIYLVDLQVTPVPGAVSPWNAGSNPRWMELHSEATGWRIHEISSSPMAGEAGSTPRTWQRVDLAQAPGLSFAVPQGWEQLGVETT
jgi:hypothetical protein